ncbi:alpha/beta hydrolase, partial [Amycolatopsis magusensis]|nr:alpha/beta hydrolase [Amycolatopsis magusensis]
MLLTGGSALGVAGVAVAGATGVLPFSEAMQRALGVASSTPATELGVTKVERVYSAARGREVDL